MHRTGLIFMSLEVGGRGAHEGGGWLQIHKKCIGMLSFSWFGEWAGGGRLVSESKQLHETVIIFMSLEVGGRGASGSRIIRNA